MGVLKDPEEYRKFRVEVVADFAPMSAIDHELVIRLASLLWRPRWAAAIETGLLQIQGEQLVERNNAKAQSAPNASSEFQTI